MDKYCPCELQFLGGAKGRAQDDFGPSIAVFGRMDAMLRHFTSFGLPSHALSKVKVLVHLLRRVTETRGSIRHLLPAVVLLFYVPAAPYAAAGLTFGHRASPLP